MGGLQADGVRRTTGLMHDGFIQISPCVNSINQSISWGPINDRRRLIRYKSKGAKGIDAMRAIYQSVSEVQCPYITGEALT